MLTRSQRRRLDENGGMMIVYSSYNDDAAPEVKRKTKKRAQTTLLDLRRELGMFGLSTEGKKQDLQGRLASHLQQPRCGSRIWTTLWFIWLLCGVLLSEYLSHFWIHFTVPSTVCPTNSCWELSRRRRSDPIAIATNQRTMITTSSSTSLVSSLRGRDPIQNHRDLFKNLFIVLDGLFYS